MLLARQIVRLLKDDENGECKFSIANYDDVIKRPNVEIADILKYAPGCFDASKVQFSVKLPGIEFVKPSRTEQWRPANEEAIFGSGCFIASADFTKFDVPVFDCQNSD